MLAQVLNTKKLADDGMTPVYVEQNHRPQLQYTPLMEEAWELTAAHWEDLAERQGAAPRAVADRPSVLDLLRTERE